ncbi:hypothetical protein BFS14_01930 [Serratia fonticola]|uniref:hypothetical protein n=1 Tax=Serratia fonticola TaxID=47917 RepID=UPI0008FD4116|nr:hypothetical protein [Serratia fonticola]OIX96247.1 hypothetical protein BFS14_01930 [Serratia fonticola]QCR60832.1 hypothetical protein FD644_10840 [Serratia fonticola]
MKIDSNDYEVINRYAGSDRSWHDRVSTPEALKRQITKSRWEVTFFLDDMKTFARIQDRLALKQARKGDSHC